MGVLGYLALIGAICGVITSTNHKYSGFLGCRFSKNVCLDDEQCVDDRLFGSCQRESSPQDRYQYYLDADTLGSLEGEIQRLITRGYTWNNLYTQCVLGNILLAFRLGKPDYDETWCDRGGMSEQEFDTALTDETLALLEEYFREYYTELAQELEQETLEEQAENNTDNEILDELDEMLYGANPEIERRSGDDDYIKIHKYYGNDKRASDDVQFDGDDEEIADEIIREGIEEDAFDQLLSQLDMKDLESLQSYLRDLDQDDSISDPIGDLGLGPQDGFRDASDSVGYMWPSAEPSRPIFTSADEGLDLSSLPEIPVATSDLLMDSVQNAAVPQFEGAEDQMTPADAALLSSLLRDEMSVSDLTDSEVARLSSHIEWILRVLESEMEMSEQQAEESIDTPLSIGEPIMSEEQLLEEEQMLAQPPEDKRSQIMRDEQDDAYSPDVHDHGFDTATDKAVTKGPRYELLEADYANLYLKQQINDESSARSLISDLEHMMALEPGTLEFYSVQDGVVTFRVYGDRQHINASQVLDFSKEHATELEDRSSLTIVNTGLGRDTKINYVDERRNDNKFFVLTFVLCGSIAGIVLAVIVVFVVRQHTRTKEKLQQLTTNDGTEATKDYQDLCRQRMQSKSSEKPEPLSAITRVGSTSADNPTPSQTSSHSSTSSWSEEPVVSNMDISTGHIVLSYMEDHLKNKDRLSEEWEALCAYEAEPNTTTVAGDNTNTRKNRYSDVLPYDHSRVSLSEVTNVSGGDYINASTITDHDPRNPAYIATQGPLPHTVADFWQMIWEQGSVVIVMLTRTTENGVAMCHRYWPEEGSDLYHIYEVHLVSEHIWCDDYLVRSFFLKNLQTNETRTVTQFHFLTWQDLGVPGSVKALLDFRRKVNKSYRGRSCPIVIHCSDGSGRTGTYCLTDMVLNRMSKGAKEIDIAATLEHIRDQRMMMVKTKEQFEFALSSVAEEVHAILKALPQ